MTPHSHSILGQFCLSLNIMIRHFFLTTYTFCDMLLCFSGYEKNTVCQPPKWWWNTRLEFLGVFFPNMSKNMTGLKIHKNPCRKCNFSSLSTSKTAATDKDDSKVKTKICLDFMHHSSIVGRMGCLTHILSLYNSEFSRGDNG